MTRKEKVKINLADAVALWELTSTIEAIDLDKLSFNLRGAIINMSEVLSRHLEENTAVPYRCTSDDEVSP